MSRVGRKPIVVPSGVEVKIDKDSVHIKGPKGELGQKIPADITVQHKDKQITVERSGNDPRQRAVHGLTRSQLGNMVRGVSEGFAKELEIVGVGYRAEVKGAKQIDFSLGFSHPVIFPLPAGIKAEMDKNTNVLKISGCDRYVVGQLAAEIRNLKMPEPYKGKGIKYRHEVLRRKAGKAQAGSGAK